MSKFRPTPTIETQRNFWDWHWDNWEERRTRNPWKDRRQQVILELLRSLDLTAPRILDIGCGTGWYTKKLADFGETTGLDLSARAIEMATSHSPHINFIAGDLYTYPLPTQHFDAVVAQEVFDHVEDQAAFVERVADLLADDGFLILSCTNRFVMERVEREVFPEQPDAHISTPLYMKELKRMLSARFDLVRSTTVIPLVGNKGILRLINSYKLNLALSSVINQRHLDAWKERAGLGYQLIAMARKR